MPSTAIIWGIIVKIANKMADLSPLFNSLYSKLCKQIYFCEIIFSGLIDSDNDTELALALETSLQEQRSRQEPRSDGAVALNLQTPNLVPTQTILNIDPENQDSNIAIEMQSLIETNPNTDVSNSVCDENSRLSEVALDMESNGLLNARAVNQK